MPESTTRGSGVKDRVTWEALAWCVLIGSAYALSLDFDRPLPHYAPGAAFWPHIVQFGMAIAAIVLLVSRFLQQTARDEAAETPEYIEEAPDDLAGVNWRTIAVFLLPLFWAYAMHQMGFLLVTPIFLIAFTWLMGVKSWRILMSFSFGFYLLLVVVFYQLIYTPLPMGAGFFHTINAEILAVLQ